jgi:FKBP-type peptidyl-prolyl cis-trans isomerase SlyD
MQLAKGKVAILDYTLTDDDGNTLDESRDGSFEYLHGASNIIPALEQALEGKQPGDELNLVLEPRDGYGERDPERVQKVSRDLFPPDMSIRPGMKFQGQTGSGQRTVVTVTEVESDGVTVDGNHPLAGERLHFDVKVVSVREASEDELIQGRPA